MGSSGVAFLRMYSAMVCILLIVVSVLTVIEFDVVGFPDFCQWFAACSAYLVIGLAGLRQELQRPARNAPVDKIFSQALTSRLFMGAQFLWAGIFALGGRNKGSQCEQKVDALDLACGINAILAGIANLVFAKQYAEREDARGRRGRSMFATSGAPPGGAAGVSATGAAAAGDSADNTCTTGPEMMGAAQVPTYDNNNYFNEVMFTKHNVGVDAVGLAGGSPAERGVAPATGAVGQQLPAGEATNYANPLGNKPFGCA